MRYRNATGYPEVVLVGGAIVHVIYWVKMSCSSSYEYEETFYSNRSPESIFQFERYFWNS